MAVVRVPATSANLGPGFDCLGAALALYARFTFEDREEGLDLSGCGKRYRTPDNLVVRAFYHTLASRRVKARGLRLAMRSDIPPARGLGSSAACVVGGILGASELYDLNLSAEEVFALATEMEGHPDNAAPAVYGGLRVSLMDGGRPLSLPFSIDARLHFLALVPDFTLSTKEARAALPRLVPREDAVYNLSRAAFLVKALERGDESLLRPAFGDRLHQDARFPLIQGAGELKALMEDAGALACYLSGAGPTLMCLYSQPDFPGLVKPLLKERFPKFSALPLGLCERGPIIERIHTNEP